MSSEGLESVGLDLEGDFASKALAYAAAGDKLGTSLDKLASSAGKVKMPELVSGGDRVKMLEADAKRASSALDKLAAAKEKIGKGQTDLASKKDSLTDSIAKSEGFGKLRGLVGKLFGDGAVGKLDGAAAKLATAGESLGISPAGLSAAGSVLGMGAGALAGAAVAAGVAAAALAYGAVKILDAVVRAGVSATDDRNKQVAILDKLSGGKGDVTFKLSMSLAGEAGVDPATALERVKGLMAAKFSKEEIPLLFKAAADLGEVKGAEKGKALLEQLEKTAAKGKATEESINGLAEAGINAGSVLAMLAKKGESLDSVRARLKAGTIDAKAFAKAVGEAVEKDFGGIAGKGLDAALNRLKIKGADLLSGFKLGPLENALANLSKVADGPQGAKLKTALSDLGTQAIKTLFGPFEGEAGKKRLESLMTSITNLATNTGEALKKAAPYVESFVEIVTALGNNNYKSENGFVRFLQQVGMAADAALFPLMAISKIMDGMSGKDMASAGKGMDLGDDAKAGLGLADMLSGVVASNDNSGATADVGGNMSKGIAQGIADNADSVAMALSDVVNAAVAKAEAELGIASPSKRLGLTGKWGALGLAKGFNDNADAPADAAAAMSGAAANAADGAGGGSGGKGGARSGGGAGGNHYVFAPVIQVGAGAGPEVEAAVSRALAAAYPAFLAMVRKAERDAREAA
jgi:hypothetical protein